MIQATNSNYIVKALGVKEETRESGIIVKQQSTESELGEVVSAGPELKNPIAIGSKVIVAWNQTIPVMVNKERSFIVDQMHVLGVVNDD
jgi:co-chaperonin GroES (HSP10)